MKKHKLKLIKSEGGTFSKKRIKKPFDWGKYFYQGSFGYHVGVLVVAMIIVHLLFKLFNF